MAAPLTDLLKASVPGTRRIAWSVECDTAFNMLKTTLTSAPVLHHFNPDLCTAVHIDGSQNAVGAVLLQRQPGETEPRSVAFMSRKLSGVQYQYHARNVEALAAQMALTKWRTIVLGVQFEIYSDHDSLKYLFTQKAPSQHILRLCEFLADYDFTEIKYVPGPQNVVPDFLSRPWEPSAPISPNHMMVTGSLDRRSSLLNLRWHQPPSVLVIPVWKDQVTVQERDGASGLWGAQVCPGTSSMEVALQAIRTILVDSTEPPDMTCVARSGNVEFQRADFGNDTRIEGGASVILYQWRRPEEMAERSEWHRLHFESLGHFGVWA